MQRGKFLNYLMGIGIEVINRNDDRDRIIDLFNPKNGRTAFMVIAFNNDYIDRDMIRLICFRLGVPLPPQ